MWRQSTPGDNTGAIDFLVVSWAVVDMVVEGVIVAIRAYSQYNNLTNDP